MAEDGSPQKLIAALVAAKADLTVVAADRTAKVDTKGGGSYSYDYADIADLVTVTTPVLAKHDLAALTPVHGHGDGLACTVMILHKSGETMRFEPLPFPHGQTAQATGSMITYHRRYALLAALGMASGDKDEDDDGASAQPRKEPEKPKLASKTNRDAITAILNKITDAEDRKAAKREYLETFGIENPEQLTAAQVGPAMGWATARAVAKPEIDKDSVLAGIRAYEERLEPDAWPAYTTWLTDQYQGDVALDHMAEGDLEQVWRYLHDLVTAGGVPADATPAATGGTAEVDGATRTSTAQSDSAPTP